MNTITIPVMGYMSRQPDGTYTLAPEKSEYADVSADAVALFLMGRFGVSAGEAKR